MSIQQLEEVVRRNGYTQHLPGSAPDFYRKHKGDGITECSLVIRISESVVSMRGWVPLKGSDAYNTGDISPTPDELQTLINVFERKFKTQ